MKKILLLTTIDDWSTPLFFSQEIQSKFQVDMFLYHEDTAALTKLLTEQSYDIIYPRDPFNSGSYELSNIKEKITTLLAGSGDAYIVDSITSFEDVLFEDKWKQYETYREFMPKTKLLESKEETDDPNVITKKRISSRAKGIAFSSNELSGELDSYIVQHKVSITKEYRVFVVCDEIQPLVSVRTSKTPTTKVKAEGTVTIPPPLREYVENVMQHCAYDLAGLDISETNDRFALIEVNRSPQFNGYFREAGVNIAEILLQQLIAYK